MAYEGAAIIEPLPALSAAQSINTAVVARALRRSLFLSLLARARRATSRLSARESRGVLANKRLQLSARVRGVQRLAAGRRPVGGWTRGRRPCDTPAIHGGRQLSRKPLGSA